MKGAKSPPLRYWLAYLDGAPRGYLSSWGGIDGVGQVEDLAVQTAYRHRGLATALLHRCITDCRDHGAGPVVIVADPTDTPKRMYAATGWRPVAVKREWRLELPRGHDATTQRPASTITRRSSSPSPAASAGFPRDSRRR